MAAAQATLHRRAAANWPAVTHMSTGLLCSGLQDAAAYFAAAQLEVLPDLPPTWLWFYSKRRSFPVVAAFYYFPGHTSQAVFKRKRVSGLTIRQPCFEV